MTEKKTKEYWIRWVSYNRYRLLILLGILLTITLIISIVIAVQIPQRSRINVTPDRPHTTEIFGVPLFTELIPQDSGGRPGIEREVKYVVIHETANTSQGADAQAHSAYLQDGGDGSTSWHYTVDDHQIYQHMPDNEVAWHAGDQLQRNGGNQNGIGVELCVNEDGDFEKTFQNAAKLTAYLLGEYRLDISAVKQHYDFNEKDCPQTIRHENRWQEFLDTVQGYLEAK